MMSISKNKRLVFFLIGVAVVLSIPLVAMQFSTEVNWSIFDFVVAGILLTGTVLSIEFILRRVKQLNHRILIASILLLFLILIWLELAVGIFGSSLAGT